ncbi:MAG: flagellin N-terminal helical domain-containing protein [Candidatus Eiseniibacteriota bacterium]
MRVTENLMLRSFLARTGGSLSTIAEWQNRISTGRRLLRASDDPLALSKALAARADLRETEAYRDNTSHAATHMSVTESALAETSDLLSRAKEIVLQGMSDTSEVGGIGPLARELRSMIDELSLIANREVAGRRLFAGTETRSAPYTSSGGAWAYRGNDGVLLEEIGPGLRVGINLTGPDAFETVPSRILGAVDLDPAVSGITPLAELFGGRGVNGGHIRITDSNGVSADLDLAAAVNVGQVIAAINNAGTAIIASVTPDGKSVQLQDTGGGPTFSVTDLYGGTLAQGLGLATTSSTGAITGLDLDPEVTENTAVALLFGGAGLGTGAITVHNDSEAETRSAVIDLASVNTVGDILDAVSGATTVAGAPLDVRASIRGSSITLESVRLHTRLSVSDQSGAVAQTLGVLGVGEARDVFRLLEDAARAIETRDHDTIQGLLAEIDLAVDNTAGVRGTYGARARQVITLGRNLDGQAVDLTIRLSDIEDADLAQAALELNQAQTVYNAALAMGARMFDRNLFDFVR